MSRSAAALAEMADAVNAGDATRHASLYAQDAVITIHGGARLEGRDAIEQYEEHLLREFPGVRLAFYSLWQQGTTTVAHYAVQAVGLGGRAMGHEGLLFYRFHPAGLIEEERRYLDSMTPMAQLGMLDASPGRGLPSLPTEMQDHVGGGSATERANVAAVTAMVDAWNAKDRAAFLRAFAADAVCDELMLPQAFVGKGAAKDWFETWATAMPDAASEITSVLGVREFVLVEMLLRGTLQGPIGRVRASQKPVTAHRAAIFSVSHGRIARASAFMNGKELAEAAGQWPPPGPC